LILLTFVAP